MMQLAVQITCGWRTSHCITSQKVFLALLNVSQAKLAKENEQYFTIVAIEMMKNKMPEIFLSTSIITT